MWKHQQNFIIYLQVILDIIHYFRNIQYIVILCYIKTFYVPMLILIHTIEQ